MTAQMKNAVVAGIGLLVLFFFFTPVLAANSIVGQWHYATSNHWSKGPVPAGVPSKGILEITQAGDQFKMEFKSGMVFSPTDLKYFTGKKIGPEYVFSNEMIVDDEGGRAINTQTLKMITDNSFKGKSFSQYSNSGIKFSWGFDIELTKTTVQTGATSQN